MASKLKGRNKQRRRHHILVSSVVTGMLTSAAPAFSADCTSGPGTQTCTIHAGEQVFTQSGKVLYTATSTSDHDTKNGNGTDNLQINDEGGTFTPSSGFNNDHGVLYGHTFGSEAEGAGDGGDAGSVNINSSGTISLSLSGSDAPRGFVTGLSQGGDGELENSHDYNSNGGEGGHGSDVSVIVNASAHYTLEGSITKNFEGVVAQSGGGKGGRQSDNVFLGQVGGKGGAGQLARVDNRGSIRIGADTPISSSAGFVTGIHAWSFGGAGGFENGSSGDAGRAEVDHSGELIVQVASKLDSQEVFGIYAHSVGSTGYKSEDNSDPGGHGGSGGDVSVSVSGGVQANVTSGKVARGGAVVAVSEGAKGGTGPNNNVGGNGGQGGAVGVNVGGTGITIGTIGDGMRGVLAISKGGEGGDGASNTAIVGHSGGGGFGGNAGKVNIDALDYNSHIITTGDYADGIAAMSLGGGGGTAGDFVGIIGGGAGNGGNGGDASDVAVRTNAKINTSGQHSYGVLAMSTSGGGGTGGVANGLVLELGGDGAAGGKPGQVQLSNSGTVETSGYDAKGLVAQSIADGGGDAGTAGGILSIGGNSDSSHQSVGNKVGLSNTGTVWTQGDAAIGILAQSIGAGGGAGAGAAGIIGVGGKGAAGGDGGQVDITSIGTVSTQGNSAYGVQAQSIGGGGGTGGDVFDLAAVAGFGVGGKGSGGGNGGSVSITGSENARITTAGYGANGLMAQSIGKGGGSGGQAIGAGLADLSIQIGGSGGGGGAGGAVSVDRSNLGIQTAGGMAVGLMAQSIGGGGGNGGGIESYTAGLELTFDLGVGGDGAVGGDGGAVGVNLKQSGITTTGSATPEKDDEIEHQTADNATAILAQSIGGGGGNGGNSMIDNAVLGILVDVGVGAAIPINLSIGGQGGAAGDGKAVNVDITDTALTTYGQYSRGIHAQSIGGGGGNGGDSSIYSLSLAEPTTPLSVTLAASVGGQCSSDHCLGGDGGNVNVALHQGKGDGSTHIVTAGDYASGILAQSVGGGGGSGGSAAAATYAWGALFSATAKTSVGGKGAIGGNGGDVAVSLEPGTAISTTGSGARGVLAQSIGGGGGESQGVNALVGLGGGIAKKVIPGFFASVSVGREGGEGGDAAAVTADNAGQITTTGRNSDGITLQSIGGGGGIGGSLGAGKDGILNTVTAIVKHILDEQNRRTFSLNGSLSVGVGGKGGTGGNGGVVHATNRGIIATAGDNADGIVAQSIGGGGGEGGASVVKGGVNTLTADVSVGGSGGSGGTGGQVNVALLNGSQISTQGMLAYGVIGQSIGGGGGMGGLGSTVQSGTLNVGAGAGGSGGQGTNGGSVNFMASDSNALNTHGDGSHGVVLQSVGGGGGIGGTASFGSDSWLWDYSLVLTLGGDGGDAGNGGAVTACGYQSECTPVNIATEGNQAIGLIAQSIGGGGGIGGATDTDNPGLIDNPMKGVSIAIGLEVGGKGGAGGDGGNATIDGEFNVSTQGDLSAGLVAQSIGGGGGLGMARTPYFTKGDYHLDARYTIRVGGGDGHGGNGGLVTLNNSGDISTVGNGAHGMVAQSIGGGGGLAGGAIKSAGGDADNSTVTGKLDEWIGGGADNTGSAVGSSNPLKEHDAVSVASLGNISTQGDWAIGLLAQSIGGGGGASFIDWEPVSGASTEDSNLTVGGGGNSSGFGGDIALQLSRSNDNTAIVTLGTGAYGILAQSIGGGGGFGAALTAAGGIPLTVGGSGVPNFSVNQNGGTVRLTGEKTVVTSGADASGVVLQSIGGGGGVAGINMPANAIAGAISVGGTNEYSTSADANKVSVDNAILRIGTSGDRAFGLVAQSIGAGGGIATAGAAGGLSQVTLGGQSSILGSADEVAISLAAGTQISTQGRGAHGIVAQSIGGGGGIAGDPGAHEFQIHPSPVGEDWSQGGGYGRTVTLNVNGDIATTGEGAFGILAQSIGGGGGLSGDANGSFAGSSGTGSGTSGLIHLTSSGSVVATGKNAVAIFTQSQGALQDGGIDLTLGGNITGGSGNQGAGVWMVGGNRNWLAVQFGANVSAGSGTAIRYSGTRNTADGSILDMQNSGTITGDILLTNLDSTNAGTVTNAGTLNPGAASKLSTSIYSGGILRGARLYQANIVNKGLLMVGRQGILDGTTITGNFTQDEQGTLLVDADFEQRRADLLHVQGDAQVAGRLDIAPLTLLPGRRLTVMTVDGNASGMMTPRFSPIFDYALKRSGKDYQLSVDGADFTSPSLGLGANQSALAGNLQQIWNSRNPQGFGKLFASIDLAAAQGLGDYRQLLSNLSPDGLLAPASQMSASMVRFNSSLMSCPKFNGTDAMTGESECLWGVVGRRDTNQDAYDDAAGFSNDSNTIQVGGQKQFAPHWFVDVSAAYHADTLSADGGRVQGKGDTAFLGAMVKREIGPWMLAGGLSESYGSYDMSRQVLVPGFGRVAKSDPEVYSTTARFRAARTFAFPKFYLKPYMDVDAIYARMPGYTEDGASLAYKVDGSDEFTFAFSPTLELGGRVELKEATLRPYVQVGATFLTNDAWTARARFANAPADVDGFQTSLPMDDAVGRVGVGLQISTGKGIDVRLQYEGEFSGHGTSNSGFLKVAVPF